MRDNPFQPEIGAVLLLTLALAVYIQIKSKVKAECWMLRSRGFWSNGSPMVDAVPGSALGITFLRKIGLGVLFLAGPPA